MAHPIQHETGQRKRSGRTLCYVLTDGNIIWCSYTWFSSRIFL